MTSMVERVARAIQVKLDDEFAERGGLTAEEMANMAARTAIEAMRDPTEAMTKVAAEDILTGPGISAFLNWQDLSASRYRLMIDAALSEEAQ